MGVRPVRALLVNENIGGHATVHHHLRRVAAEREDVTIDVEDVPVPNLARRLAGAPVPVLTRWDADLRPARYQLAQSAWVARQLPGWLARGYDVVHLYTHNAGLLARRPLRSHPYVVTLDSTNAQSNLLHPTRETTRFSGWSTPVTRPFERSLFAGAARVVANSRWAANSLEREYGVPAERVVVLPMGVPLAASGPATRDPQPSINLPTVVFIGRSMARKGGGLVLAAHQRRLADRCRLVLVTGDDVPGAASLRNVTVLSDVRPGDGQIEQVLTGALAMALPSAIDQWPNAVMEAMAHGVVPIVSDVGGMPEMVAEGAGIVLEHRTADAIADAVEGLLDDPGRRRRMAAASYDRVRTTLDVHLTANQLLDEIVSAAR